MHDYAGVPSELSVAAETEARRIFYQAGVETVWLNYSPKLQKAQPSACHIVDSTHLAVQLLAGANSLNHHYKSDVLGIASMDRNGVGYYVYIFYDRVRRISEERKLGEVLLADVLAHEIGHLLLGPASHSLTGIMSGQWVSEGFWNISKGSMKFASSQSRMLQNRLRSGGNRSVVSEPKC